MTHLSSTALIAQLVERTTKNCPTKMLVGSNPPVATKFFQKIEILFL